MAKTVDLSSQAKKDLQDIWYYIAQDNFSAADRVEYAFYEAFDKLVLNPHVGHKRDDLTRKPVRFWSVYSYQILYDPESSPLRIIRILSDWRNLKSLLDD